MYNFYSSVQGGKDLGKESIKAGLETSRNNWVCNVRAAFQPSTHGVTLYHKIAYSQDKWRFWAVNAANAVKKDWIMSAFQVAYNNKCCSWYLRANANKNWGSIKPKEVAKDLLSDVTADYIYKYNDNNQLGVEVSSN